MEDVKLNIEKLNKSAADLPEVKRKEDGSIDLEAITIEIDGKDNRIIPDEIFNAYYKELPNKVINKSKSWRTSNGGKIKILGGDPENDRAIHEAGGKALQATLEQRRSIKEILEQLSRKAANPEDIERLGLEEGTTTLEAANYAAIQRAIRGDIKALEYIRDTLGEKPTEKIEQSVDICTREEADDLRGLLEDIKSEAT